MPPLRPRTDQQAKLQQLAVKGNSLEAAGTIAAIRRGIKDAEEGRVMSLEEAAACLRNKHGL
jgi:hypothetical protein